MNHWLKQIRSRRRLTADLSEEMQQHLDEKIEALIADGMPREEASMPLAAPSATPRLIEQRSREVWMWPLSKASRPTSNSPSASSANPPASPWSQSSRLRLV